MKKKKEILNENINKNKIKGNEQYGISRIC